MARGRMISKSLSTSEKFGALVSLGDLAEFTQLLYPLLVIHSDDFGRLQGDPYTVKLRCFPMSPRPLEHFAEALRQLNHAELIVWYVSDGKQYIQVKQFEQHQLGLHRRTASHFPEIPGMSGNFPEPPGKSGNVREIPSELKRTKEKRTKDKNPPTPLAAQRGSRRPNRPNSVCPHTPTCQRWSDCTAKILADGRKARGA